MKPRQVLLIVIQQKTNMKYEYQFVIHEDTGGLIRFTSRQICQVQISANEA
jgi:hypothetical protein